MQGVLVGDCDSYFVGYVEGGSMGVVFKWCLVVLL